MVLHAEQERAAARAGSKALIREINEALVLDVVRRRGVTSRAEITAVTGLSPATVTGITGQLVGDRLLIESDVLRGTGGRPARLLELGRDAVVAAGVRLARDSVEATLVDLRGDVIARYRSALSSTDPDVAADAVVAAVAAVRAEKPQSRLRGVSIALSGIVDRARGTVRHSGSLGWRDVPFAALVAQRSGLRVLIDSLVNSFATGLLLLDEQLAHRDALVFNVGISLGVSVLVEGRIHRGFAGSAGGFAHSALGVRDASRPCHCGDVGCLETWSSLWGMSAERERRGLRTSDPVDAGPDDVLQEGGERLGVAVANAAKMFAPERVVLVLAADVFDSPFAVSCEDAIEREFLHGETSAPQITFVPADSDVFARGAGYDMITELFAVDGRDAV